ncbi:MAG: transposase [Candidatus Glassbacteria bacterium]|nr:transposase [Candidatus Glassbacteria bacterium]
MHSYLHFSSISNKQATADFTGSEMTPDAGPLLLRETEKMVGHIETLTKVAGNRHPGYAKHTDSGLLSQKTPWK